MDAHSAVAVAAALLDMAPLPPAGVSPPSAAAVVIRLPGVHAASEPPPSRSTRLARALSSWSVVEATEPLGVPSTQLCGLGAPGCGGRTPVREAARRRPRSWGVREGDGTAWLGRGWRGGERSPSLI